MTDRAREIILEWCNECMDSGCDQYVLSLWAEGIINKVLLMDVPYQEIHTVVDQWWKSNVEGKCEK